MAYSSRLCFDSLAVGIVVLLLWVVHIVYWLININQSLKRYSKFYIITCFARESIIIIINIIIIIIIIISSSITTPTTIPTAITIFQLQPLVHHPRPAIHLDIVHR
jgi:hypothetical protein